VDLESDRLSFRRPVGSHSNIEAAAVECVCVANIAIPFVIAAGRGRFPCLAQLQGADVDASVTFTGSK
jgi:hypothetical protein